MYPYGEKVNIINTEISVVISQSVKLSDYVVVRRPQSVRPEISVK